MHTITISENTYMPLEEYLLLETENIQSFLLLMKVALKKKKERSF